MTEENPLKPGLIDLCAICGSPLTDKQAEDGDIHPHCEKLYYGDDDE